MKIRFVVSLCLLTSPIAAQDIEESLRQLDVQYRLLAETTGTAFPSTVTAKLPSVPALRFFRAFVGFRECKEAESRSLEMARDQESVEILRRLDGFSSACNALGDSIEFELLELGGSSEAAADSSPAEPVIRYGEDSDLKGVRSVFIDTSGDVEARDGIRETIEDRVEGLIFTESASEADVILEFEGGSREVPGSTVRWGEGYIYKLIPEGYLVIRSFKLEPERYRFGFSSPTLFGRVFTEAFLSVNPKKVE